jgi:hypothetical protein
MMNDMFLSMIGLFNVTMIVTNGYGRSSAASNLYRLSATGQLYTLQTYASMFLKSIL